MIVSATAIPHSPAVPRTTQAATDLFQTVVTDMTSANQQLEDVSGTNTFPSIDWVKRVDLIAAGLDSARMGLSLLRPDAADLVVALGRDVRHIAKDAGILQDMSNHRHTFENWNNTFDVAIGNAQRAVQLLASRDGDDKLPPDSDEPKRPDTGDRLPQGPSVPGGGGGDVPAPGDEDGQSVPPTDVPQGPARPGQSPEFVRDVQQAVSLIGESVGALRGLPQEDTGSEGTKQARISAFHVNRSAQDLLEKYFDTATPEVASTLHTADASLEDAAWQMAKKPSPDGRFNGVDLPGAIADSEAAAQALAQLLNA
ncbi:MAG: hypothetical protein JWN72_2505 [Thermoleophilia bacterium]|nr:hypothetical protein [Thermoleophilia bacterium]